MKKRNKKYLSNLYDYNAKTDTYQISLSLRNYEEIYNPYDYSQYKKRDMDEDFLDYIYDETLGIPLKHNVKLTMHIKEEAYAEEKTKNVKNAIKNNFSWRMGIIEQRLKELYSKCMLLLLAGILFLVLTFGLSNTVNKDNTFFDIFGESLSIIGWVFLWDLVEILAFDLTKLLKKKRYLKRLVNSKVEFETYK